MVNVAKIINTRGLKGECKVYLKTDSAKERFSKGSSLYLEDGSVLKVKKFNEQGNLGYVMFDGIDTIEQADKLKNKMLMLPEDELPEPEEGEYYYHQLMGCTVENQAGENTGKVSEILETGANLVLRVSRDKKSYLLPFVNAHIISVDPEKKIIVINDMEGLR